MNEDHLNELSVGARVVYHERSFVVRGFSPMGVVPQRLWLADAETGDQFEVAPEEVLVEREPSSP